MRLIDADRLMGDFLCTFYNDLDDQNRTEKLINEAQTVEERPHGEWIITGGYRPSYKCSICGYSYSSNFIYSANFIEHNFCPNCGAKMKEGEAK